MRKEYESRRKLSQIFEFLFFFSIALHRFQFHVQISVTAQAICRDTAQKKQASLTHSQTPRVEMKLRDNLSS